MDPSTIMLAMQAAGMVVNMFGQSQQEKLAGLGAQLDQAAYQNEILNSRLQTVQSSNVAMAQLRQTLGTQAAIFAARGTSGAAGSALTISQNTIHNFGQNEQVRRLNQYSREVALKGKSASSILDQQAFRNKINQKQTEDLFKFGADAGSWAENKWGANSNNQTRGMTDWGMRSV